MVSHFRALRAWGERHTKTDLGYLASGGFWLGGSHVVMGLIAFGVSVAFARFISPDAYGTYRFLLAAFWTMTAFSMNGLSSAMARAVARGAEGAYAQSLVPYIIGCLPMAVLGLSGSVYYYLNDNTQLALGMLLIAVLGTFFQPSYLFGSFLEGKRAFKLNGLCGIIVSAVPALALLATMFFSENPLVFFGVYLGANILTGAGLSLFVYTRYRPNTRRDPGLLTLGLHLSANNILATIAGQADKLLLYHVLGAAPVALYTFAVALPDQIKTLSNSIASVAFPKFAARPIEEIMPTLPYRLALLTLGLVAAAGVYWFLAPWLFSIFFPAYTASIWYSQLYALALIPVANVIPLTLLEAQAAKRELYLLNTISPIVQIGVLFVLISMYGLLGAVIARIVSRLFNLALNMALVHSYARRAVRGAPRSS